MNHRTLNQRHVALVSSKYVKWVLCLVLGLFFVGPTIGIAAGIDQEALKFNCDLIGVERTSEEGYNIRNLDPIRVAIRLEGANWPLDKIAVAPFQESSNESDEPTVTVAVNSMPMNGVNIPISLNKIGSQFNLGINTIVFILEIPTSEESRRAGFERYFQALMSEIDLEDPVQVKKSKRLQKGKEKLYNYLRNSIYENKTGEFKLNCQLSIFESNNLEGAILADSIFIDIEFDKNFFDQEVFLPNPR